MISGTSAPSTPAAPSIRPMANPVDFQSLQASRPGSLRSNPSLVPDMVQSNDPFLAAIQLPSSMTQISNIPDQIFPNGRSLTNPDPFLAGSLSGMPSSATNRRNSLRGSNHSDEASFGLGSPTALMLLQDRTGPVQHTTPTIINPKTQHSSRAGYIPSVATLDDQESEEDDTDDGLDQLDQDSDDDDNQDPLFGSL